MGGGQSGHPALRKSGRHVAVSPEALASRLLRRKWNATGSDEEAYFCAEIAEGRDG